MSIEKNSETSRNSHLAAIQKSRNDMGRLLAAQEAIEKDPILVEEDKDGLLYIVENKAQHIYQIMRDWEE